MRILISGASGFIGRHLVEHLLEDRHELMLLIRNPTQPKDGITWLKGDLETPQDLKERIEQFQPEAVFHLAWAGIPDFSESQCRLNVQLSLNFLGMISQISSVKKLVVAGSCWEYGDRVGECTESDETHAHNWFTWAKDTICQYTERLCDDRQIDWYWGKSVV